MYIYYIKSKELGNPPPNNTICIFFTSYNKTIQYNTSYIRTLHILGHKVYKHIIIKRKTYSLTYNIIRKKYQKQLYLNNFLKQPYIFFSYSLEMTKPIPLGSDYDISYIIF